MHFWFIIIVVFFEFEMIMSSWLNIFDAFYDKPTMRLIDVMKNPQPYPSHQYQTSNNHAKVRTMYRYLP